MRKRFILEEQPIIDLGSCEAPDSSKVESTDNKIYFYSPVNQQKVLELNRKIREIDLQNVLMQASKTGFDPDDVFPLDPIYIFIQSYGGSVFSGLSAMDTILQCKSPVYTIIDGAAASAATFISIVGTKRYITKHSFALIHQLSSASWGKYEEMKEDMTNNDKLMEVIKNIYLQYTTIKKKELEEVLKHDLWFDAKKCLEMGIVDKVI